MRCALRSADEQYGRWRVDFGKLPRDAGPQTKSIVFERAEGGPLDIKVLGIEPPFGTKDEPAPDSVEARVRMLERGERYALDITVKPPWPNQWIHGRVRVSTGVKEQPEDEVGFGALLEPQVNFGLEPSAVARLWAQPPKFAVPQVAYGALELRATVVWSEERPPGQILEVAVNDDALTAELVEHDGAQEVVLHVPDGYRPAKDRWVGLTTSDEAVPVLRIPVLNQGLVPLPAAPASAPTKRIGRDRP